MNVSKPVLIRSLALAAGAALAGCAATPLGPTVQVMPGPGKSFDTFQADVATCRSFAAGQVQGQAQAANQQAAGTAAVGAVAGAALGALTGAAFGNAGAGAAAGAALGAGTGGAVAANGNANAQMSIQAQYDAAYSQCMYSHGEQVPGYAPVVAAPPPVYSGPDPALVRGVQMQLIRLHYLNPPADGVAGPQTAAAIRQYEQTAGLPVDGIVSGPLLARLQATEPGGPALVAPVTSSAPPPPPGAAPAPGAPPPPGAPPAAPGGLVQPTNP